MNSYNILYFEDTPISINANATETPNGAISTAATV